MKNNFVHSKFRPKSVGREISSVYNIPDTYIKAFKENNINESWYNYFFHIIQFGVFTIKIDNELVDSERLEEWVTIEKVKKTKLRYNKVTPKKTFLETFGSLYRENIDRDWSRKKVVLTSHKPKDVKLYTEEEIREIVDFVKEYNRYVLENIRVGSPRLNSCYGRDVNLEHFNSTAYFKASLKAGGRLFCAGVNYQNIPKYIREVCKINGGGILEIDLVASVTQFFKITCKNEGINLDNYSIFQEDDVYLAILNNIVKDYEGTEVSGDIMSDMKFYRELVKGCVVRAICSPKKSRERSIGWFARGNAEIFIDEFNQHILKLIDELEKRSEIPIHLILHKAEAGFLRDTLQRTMKQGLHCLPIHDCWVFPSDEKGSVQQILEDTALKRYGHELIFSLK